MEHSWDLNLRADILCFSQLLQLALGDFDR